MLNRYLSLTCLPVCLFALSACGGGGSTPSTPSTPPPPPPPSNQVPVANATAESASITEGRLINLSASTSTDADSDTLTFSWNQITGPTAAINGTATAVDFSAEAPDVQSDTILTFEVTVSDGTANASDTVSITIEPLAFQSLDDINAIPAAISPSTANSYTLVTGGDGIGRFNFISQEFSSDGTPIGDPVSGSLTPENSDENSVLFLEDVIQSGDTTYTSFSSTFTSQSFGGPEAIRLSTLRGPINEDFQSLGDQYAEFISEIPFLAHDAIAIGNQQLATIVIVPSNGSGRDVVAHIVNPDGTLAASQILAVQAPFAESAILSSFDADTLVGFWIVNDQIFVQQLDGVGDPIGATASLDPIEGRIFSGLSATPVSGDRIVIVSSEGPNTSPRIVFRNLNRSGSLAVPATEIGRGTDPQAITLNDGNVLVVWAGASVDTELVGRIVSPEGENLSDVHVFGAGRIGTPLRPVQLTDGTTLIVQDLDLLSFPIENIEFFPVVAQ